MIARYNRQSFAAGLPGILLQIGSLISLCLLSNNEERLVWASMSGLLLGVLLWSIGLCFYAKAKGYSAVWGLLGCFSGLGLIILALLPDKVDSCSALRIFDIELYRDGGSTVFKVNRRGQTKEVRLDTPFHGEPRKLWIDSILMGAGEAEVAQLIGDIEEWWKSLPKDLQAHAQEALAHTGPFINPSSKMKRAIDVSHVLLVRDYISKVYAA